jgi:hypothetical protein
MRARWLLVSLVVILAARSQSRAQPASAQAQSLFDGGRVLMQSGKFAEACAAFESSQKLDPRVTTLLNLADCREQNHQLATAWALFAEAGRVARASNNDKLAGVADNHVHKLEPRLSKLTITVAADPQVPGLEVLRGSDRVDAASRNRAVPVDGGSYTITARAPGRTPWSITKTIKVEGDAQTIEIPKLADPRPLAVAAAPVTASPPAAKPAAPVSPSPSPSPAKPAVVVDTHTGSRPEVPPPATAAAATEPTDPPAHAERDATPVPEAPSPSRPSRVVPIVLGASAIVLAGVAVGFEIAGNSKYDQAVRLNGTNPSGNFGPDPATQREAQSLYQQANNRRYIAEGLGVAAIGCAGVAVYLYVRNRGEQRAETAAVTPIASPGLAGLAVVGSW